MIFNDLFAQTLLKKSCTQDYLHSGRINGLDVFILNWFQLYFLHRCTHTCVYKLRPFSKRKMQLLLQFDFWFVFLWRCVKSSGQPAFQDTAAWNSPMLSMAKMKWEEGAFNFEFYYSIVVFSSGRFWLHYSSKLASKSMA